ncbi:Replication factor C (RF-C) subunit [Glugoides intestinalis]
MLWIEKYRPVAFEDIKSHKENCEMLQKYTLETIPNLIIHGQPGHNKKTIMYALLRHLYGSYPTFTTKMMEIETGATKTVINYLECNEIVEICPSEYGYRDRYVVQGVIKEMAQSRPILSLFSTRKKAMKILIIDQAEDLSKDAQASLRRTIETHSSYFRIILVCTELSKLIEPIKSRCLMLRMRGFTMEEFSTISMNITSQNGVNVTKDVIETIYSNCAGNCKRALCLLELYCHNHQVDNKKRQKTDYSQIKLEWEEKVDSLVEMVKKAPKTETMIAVRKEVYSLLNSQIPPSIILSRMVRNLCKSSSFETCKAISAFGLGYEERIRLGTKALYHLEAFIASVMVILSQKKQ